MKIVFIADLHLSKSVYGVMSKEIPSLPFRTVDFMKSFEWMIDKAINDIKPDLLVIGGDVYDYYEASNTVRGFFSNQVSKLITNKIPCVTLIGNHDICQRSHALNDIQELKLKTIKIVDRPLITEFKEHMLCLFPYSLDIEQKKMTLQEAFNKFSEEVKSLPPDKPALFFGHFGIYGASMNEYKKEELEEDEANEDNKEVTRKTTTKLDYNNSRKEDIHTSQLDDMGVDYIFMGDFHKHQRLNTKTKGWYSGSIERTGFTEMGQVKGFMVYDSNAQETKEYGKCSFIEYPNCRPMIEIKGNLAKMKSEFQKYDSKKYNGAIVRLVFHGTSNELLDFSSGIDEFKQEIVKKINPIHVFTDQKSPKDKIQSQAATALEKEIMERGHFTDKDILDVLNEMVGEKVKDKKEQEETMKIADLVYKETKELV